jgi:hypothetical protein
MEEESGRRVPRPAGSAAPDPAEPARPAAYQGTRPGTPCLVAAEAGEFTVLHEQHLVAHVVNVKLRRSVSPQSKETSKGRTPELTIMRPL